MSSLPPKSVGCGSSGVTAGSARNEDRSAPSVRAVVRQCPRLNTCGAVPRPQRHPASARPRSNRHCTFRPYVIDSEGSKVADRVRRWTATRTAPAMSSRWCSRPLPDRTTRATPAAKVRCWCGSRVRLLGAGRFGSDVRRRHPGERPHPLDLGAAPVELNGLHAAAGMSLAR